MRFAPGNHVPAMDGPNPRPAEKDEDEDAEPEGFPAMEGAGKHRLKVRFPRFRSDAFHPAVVPDEKGGPGDEEEEDEEPVGNGQRTVSRW